MSAIVAAAEEAPPVDPEIDPKTVFIRIATEFAAVLFQLVCFSRLGPNDYYYVPQGMTAHQSVEPSLAANLVLFVTLVIFQFPFMNGYILFMYDTCVIGRFDKPAHIWRVFLCLLLVGVQVCAAWVATVCIHAAQAGQKPWRGTITWMAAGKKLEALDEGRNWGVEFLEEFVAVTALLVGYIHLTYLNFEYRKENKEKLFRSTAHHFSKIDPVIQKLAIPLPFILQVTLLVAGLLRAFPTAHLSPHVSVYIVLMGYTTDLAFVFRILGGVAGFLVSYVLFWGFYVGRTGVHDPPEIVERVWRCCVSAHKAGEVHEPLASVVADQNGAASWSNMRPLPPPRTHTPRRNPGTDQPVDDVTNDRKNPAISFNNAYRYAYHAI